MISHQSIAKVIIKIYNLFDNHRSLAAFSIVLGMVLFGDSIFFNLPMEYFGIEGKQPVVTIDFAPETWLGLFAFVLGTLIIVISIASQSTPKLIDLYIGDWISLLFVWFIAIGTIHNLWLQVLESLWQVDWVGSELLNTYIMLPIAMGLTIPYVLYMLRYTKTNNVIDKIHKEHTLLLRQIGRYPNLILMSPKRIHKVHYKLFEQLNQLDNILEYVSFKEPKSDIVMRYGDSLIAYMDIKAKLPDNFFQLSYAVKNDISFRTLADKVEDMEVGQSFYEQKIFRLMGNAFQVFLEHQESDLASLCASEVYKCGKAGIKDGNQELSHLALIRFNTFLRFGIKQSLQSGDIRNLYNTVFHYSKLVSEIIIKKDRQIIILACRYLHLYGLELYKHSTVQPSFIFMLDVFAWELKKLLIEMDQGGISKDTQSIVLSFFLKLDNPPDFDEAKPKDNRPLHDGVRQIQMIMALYYLSIDNIEFTDRIVDDILEDIGIITTDQLSLAIKNTCKYLADNQPDYWEETDRGNTNIYYSPHKEYISTLEAMIMEKIEAIK